MPLALGGRIRLGREIVAAMRTDRVAVEHVAFAVRAVFHGRHSSLTCSREGSYSDNSGVSTISNARAISGGTRWGWPVA